MGLGISKSTEPSHEEEFNNIQEKESNLDIEEKASVKSNEEEIIGKENPSLIDSFFNYVYPNKINESLENEYKDHSHDV